MKYTKELNALLKANVIATLERHFDSVIDVSYSNDSTDSLLIDEKYLLFLPNADETNLDNEETNYFLLMRDEDYGIFNEEALEFVSYDLYEVMREICQQNILTAQSQLN
jgi:hypothetical protein